MDKVTPESIQLNRREWLKKAALAGLIVQFPSLQSAYASSLKITPERKATRYNNYYEFSDNKEVVVHLAKEFKTSPWDLEISGLVDKPINLNISQLPESEERIYRFRCVEGWSMVVPWQGFSLYKILELAKPKAEAKYVRFVGTYRPSEMIGQRRSVFEWPYQEGLRLDEAMHPLTILATGMYQKPLPAQNGGPLRLVVPWKYGFKSIKAITRIELVAEQPKTTWNLRAPEEYGFYANVNPAVAHPRWSQRREVPLGETRKIKTLPFNGYEKEVSHLYSNMDLAKHY